MKSFRKMDRTNKSAIIGMLIGAVVGGTVASFLEGPAFGFVVFAISFATTLAFLSALYALVRWVTS